MFSSNKGAIVY